MNFIKEDILNEMAISRSDAIDKCEELGIKFIEHFEKIIKEPKSSSVNHWMNEMQRWLDRINKFVLTQNKKLIPTGDKINWFFNANSTPEILIKDSTIASKYEDFIEIIIKNNNVKKSFDILSV